MNPRLRSGLALLGTFVLGVVLGALAIGALVHHRHGRVHDLHHREGFVLYVLGAVEPRDEAQRRAILPHVEAAARATRSELMATHTRLLADLAAMRDSLRPILSDEQMERLESSLEMAGRHAEPVPAHGEHRDEHRLLDEPRGEGPRRR